MKIELNPKCFAKSEAPYSHGILSSNMIFTTQVGEDESGNVVKGGVYEQTKQIHFQQEHAYK